MSKAKDFTGQLFGRLIILKRAGTHISPKGEKRALWKCLCDCGKEKEIGADYLTRGKTTSCGCYSEEVAKNKAKQMSSDETIVIKAYGKRISNNVDQKITSINNKSGKTGVCYDKRRGKWRAYITFNKYKYRLGHFKEKEDAIKARVIAEEMYFEPFLEWYNNEFKNNRKNLKNS